MKRLPDWEKRLAGYIAGCAVAPLAYGKHDCATFALGAVRAMTGVDVRGDYGNYTTLRGGARVLKRAGFDDIGGLFADRFKETDTSAVGPGDLVTFDTQDGPAAGVFVNRNVFAVTERGLVPTSVANATRGFRV